MKVYFVRHGESVANLNRFYAGQSDVKLTETGRAQAEVIRPVLADIPFDKVYSSDLSRAMDTQKIALPGYVAETTPLLREIDVGNLAGKSMAAVAAQHGGVSPTAQSSDYKPYGGEDRAMLAARICRFMEMLAQTNYENVAVFAHRGVMMGVLRYILGTPDLPNHVLVCNNCAVNVVEFDGKRWHILALNYMKKI